MCTERAGCTTVLRLAQLSVEFGAKVSRSSKCWTSPRDETSLYESSPQYDGFVVAASRCYFTVQRPRVFFALHLAKANATYSPVLHVTSPRASKFSCQPIRQRHSPSLFVHFPEGPLNNLTFFTTSISTTPMASSSSNVVGVHYRVGKKIGEGSFGVIFEGTNLLNNQQVAIKFVCAWSPRTYTRPG